MNKTINLTVDLEDFDYGDIREFAKDNLDMVDNISEIDTDDLLEELESRGVHINQNFYYPNNSIIDADLIERFIDGYSDINKGEFEELLQKHGL